MGGAEQILKEIFQTHADPEWRIKVAGWTSAHLSMWPFYRCPYLRHPITHHPQRGRTGGGKDGPTKCGLDGTDGFERLDQVDSLTARMIQMLQADAPDRLAIMAVMEPRWASARAVKPVDHLAHGLAIRSRPALSSPSDWLAQSLNDGQPMPPIDGGSPQLCRERGPTVLAQRRGEVRPEMVENLAVLGLATFPFPPRCFVSRYRS